MSKWLRHCPAFVGLALALGASQLRADVFSVDAVKAAFLYRFASYVEWPAEVSAGPFVIAVAGAEEVAGQLEALLPRMTVRGRPAQLRRVTKPSELEGVHILYVGSEMLARTRSLRATASQRPVLIVTDDEHGFEAGAVINFREANRNVRFEISLVAADRARLKIDAALLSVAARVERRPQAWQYCTNCPMRMAAAGPGVSR
jgi:uncharacterized protein DUF4154